jgi:hypothetical protein
MNNTHG